VLKNKYHIPLLFLIFNRPETEKRVFEQIRKIKPKYLFVAADGPRKNRVDDVENCRLAREIVDNGVDWDCEVKKLYRDENLGCKYAVSGAIDWFFENVEEGIILEDDCLPDLSFFKFCKDLLVEYRNNASIMHISGDNFLMGKLKMRGDYYFSKNNYIWGWATWRRAWKLYDVEMRSYPYFKADKGVTKIWKDREISRYWTILMDKTYNGNVDTWDYQWMYSLWKNQGLAICPKYNLVENIGFGDEGTHTTVQTRNVFKSNSMEISCKPAKIIWNERADHIAYENIFKVGFLDKIKYFLNHL